MTVPSSVGAAWSSGPMPEPMMVVSTGRNRLPSTPVGRKLWNTMRTARSLVAAMIGPRYCGGVTPIDLVPVEHHRA